MSVLQLPRSLHPDFSTPNRQPVSKNIKVTRHDVVAAVICNEINPIEYVKGHRGEDGNAVTLDSRYTGRNLEFNGSSDSIDWDAGLPYGITGTEFAIFVRVYLDTTGGSQYIISCSKEFDNDPTYNYCMQVYEGDLYCSFGSGGADKDYTPSGGVSSGVWMDLCVGYDGTDQFVYRDGELQGSSSANSGLTLDFNTGHSLNIGSKDSNGSHMNGRVEVAVVMNRWPGEAFVKSMARDPYQIFEPQMPMFYFINSGTGVTGALAETLANDTLAATAVVGYIGSVSETLADDTLAASGSIGVSGSVNETLANDTLAATTIIGYIGSLSETLADDTITATAKLGYIGSVADTLADDTLAASGGVGTNGYVNETLEDDTLAASGLIGLTGYLNETLQDDTLASSGTVTGTGTATPPTFQRASVQNITIGL